MIVKWIPVRRTEWLFVKVLMAIILLCQPAFSAGAATPLVQLTGMVVNEDGRPMEYAHILILNRPFGAITNERGLFSIVVAEHDSIRFSTIGYKASVLIIPDSLTEPHYHVEITLRRDTFQIEQVDIYPWKTYEDFKQALVELKTESKELENAKRNIAIIRAQIFMDTHPDPGVNFKQVMNQEMARVMVGEELVPYNALLNPISWVQFFQALKNGDFKRKDYK